MYWKRATVLTPKSLATLYKVCSPRENASDYFKIVTLVRRHLSSANGLADFRNPNSDNGQNPINQNYAGYVNDSRGNDYVNNGVEQDGNNYGGIYGKNDHSGGYQSHNGVYVDSSGYSNFGYQSAPNSNFGFYGRKEVDFRQNSNVYQNHDGVNRDGLSTGSFGTSAEQSENFRGSYGQDSRGSYRHRSNLNGLHIGPTEPRQQNLGVFSPNGVPGFQEYQNGFYTESSGQFQQSPSYKQYQHNHQPESGGFSNTMVSSLQGIPRLQGNPNPQLQKTVNGHRAGEVAIDEQSPRYGDYQQNYWPNSDGFNNTTLAAQVPTYANPEGVSGSGLRRDPLEELDGFSEEGKVEEAVELLKSLEGEKIAVDLPRYLRLMQACGEAEALEEAKYVHGDMLRSHPDLSVSSYNKILEMYSRCGSMEDAISVFKTMPGKNLTTWDTTITWLAKNGFGEDAIDLFTEFKKAGMEPDGQMFIGVFYACSIVMDVDEGLSHFESMRKDFGIVPTMDHFVSIVDMLGSAGYLDEAMEFIEEMPLEPSAGVWETLMNLCRAHGNSELGDRCAELVEQLEPSRLNRQSKEGLVPVKASDLAKEKAKKKKSQNPLEVKSQVHEYRAGDRSHPENDKIYAKLRGLKEQMKEAGYIPETRFVLHDIDQESKEEALLAHSERLAVSYGLLTSSARSPLRIIKNLRVCGDCHTALKIISKIVGRELIIRDAKRFHHFKDGLCSCRDYW